VGQTPEDTIPPLQAPTPEGLLAAVRRQRYPWEEDEDGGVTRRGGEEIVFRRPTQAPPPRAHRPATRPPNVELPRPIRWEEAAEVFRTTGVTNTTMAAPPDPIEPE
jgi:hypothetical protein